ncbi:cysteine-rich receptor-like protein kinase [Trifolium pratense]|uniref:Cysteine-rich receptor-like protein kinase n=1 Tax=Trifolium pratense TaxID=57577 RepID=A0A2K3LVJ4_TRIPR|nr:cysteine-rich receptor-like protein kinase [Trifolium pratense]
MYKVLAKILANRLKSVIDKVISKTQSPVIKGRQIMDDILIANEAVDDAKKCKKELLLFKVDNGLMRVVEHLVGGKLFIALGVGMRRERGVGLVKTLLGWGVGDNDWRRCLFAWKEELWGKCCVVLTNDVMQVDNLDE